MWTRCSTNRSHYLLFASACWIKELAARLNQSVWLWSDVWEQKTGEKLMIGSCCNQDNRGNQEVALLHSTCSDRWNSVRMKTNMKTFCSLLADFTFEGKGSAIVARLLYQKTKHHIWLGKRFKYTEWTSFPPKVTESIPAFPVTLVSETIILTTILELKRRIQQKEYKKGT